MIQPKYSNKELLKIANESYENIVRFCQVLDTEGYWEEPGKFLKYDIYDILDMYLQAVMLNLAVYCGNNEGSQRKFMRKVTSSNPLACSEDRDLSQEALIVANKILRTPPIILQLCGLRDKKQMSFFSSYFIDSVFNILLAFSLLDQRQSKFADKFLGEFYEKISSFINEDQKHEVVNQRYLFIKLSSEKFFEEKAQTEKIKLLREEEKARENLRKVQKEVELEKLERKETELEELEKQEQKETEQEELEKLERKETELEELEKQEQKETEQEELEKLERKEIEREEAEELELEKDNEYEQKMEKKKTVFDLSDEELMALQKKGKLKIKTPRMDQMKKESEAALQKAQDEKVKQIKQEINKINHAKKLQQLLEELNGLVGLSEVKKEIESLINLIKVKKMRESYNMPSMDISYHMVFTGNPGTGKTTVARLVAQIYKELGILSKGHLVEVDRAGLVAGYVGQTAIKVKEVVNKSLGGVLFIDEAYSLTNKNDTNDFGGEAIDTLVKMMEDHRDDLVIIVAGYKKEMDEFLKANTGLISRFNKFIDFEDYSNEEMMEILEMFLKKSGLEMEEEAKNVVANELEQMSEEQRFLFGNGRGMRNTFESILGKQANRIVELEMPTEEDLTRILPKDVESIIAND